MTDLKRVAWNFLAGASGRVLFALLGLVTFGVLTRSLGTEEFGLYRTIFTYVCLAGVCAHMGTPAVALREISRSDVNQSVFIANAIAFRLVLMTVVMAIAYLLIPVFGFEERVRLGVLIAAAGWICLETVNVVNAVFQNRLQQHLASSADVIGAAFTCVLVLTFAFFKAGLAWMVSSFLVGRSLSLLLAWRWANRNVELGLSFDPKTWVYLLRHGWPVGASVAVTILIARGDLMTLAVVRTAEDVGIYGVSSKILEILVTLPNVLAPLLVPGFVHSLSDTARLELYVNAGLRAVVGIALFVSCVLFNFSPEVIGLVAGPGYEQAAIVLRIMSITVTVLFASTLLRFVLISMGRQQQMLHADLAGLAVVIPGYAILIPIWSIRGAAIAMLLAHGTILLTALIIVVRHLRMRLEYQYLIKLSAIILCLHLLFSVGQAIGLNWMLSITAGGAFFLVLCVVSGVVPVAALRRSSSDV
jgi:O-antigen/teichoic acid export membrane protein